MANSDQSLGSFLRQYYRFSTVSNGNEVSLHGVFLNVNRHLKTYYEIHEVERELVAYARAENYEPSSGRCYIYLKN
jgi:hypothetical protein